MGRQLPLLDVHVQTALAAKLFVTTRCLDIHPTGPHEIDLSKYPA